MRAFTFEQLPMRVVFAAGAAACVGDEVRRGGWTRAMVLHDAVATGIGDDISGQLGELQATRWDEVAQHVPVPLAERARATAASANVDVVVCIGGGSATGLAKAIALTNHVPIIAVPTTYAGSEQTTIYGLTDTAHKQTGKDPRVLPAIVIYDPALTLALPPHVTGPSAFNALAHSVEGMYAAGCNPITTALALEAVRAIASSLPKVMHAPHDVEARGDLLYGAALSGMVLGATSAGLHHKICHVLGGMFNLVHADAHSVVLPHAIAFNQPALPDEMERLADALGKSSMAPATQLWDLAVASGVPTKLADLVGASGPLQRDDLPAVAEQVATEAKANPRPVSTAALLELLHNAYEGVRP